MYVNGYAYRSNEQEEKIRRHKRYQEIKNLPILISKKETRYNKVVYSGTYKQVEKEISEEDIALFCDDGNVPFGAQIECKDGWFTCTIYTD